MKNFNLIFLTSIIGLAIFLRTYHLDSVPPALFGDEVDVGYQAYSLLRTGQDLYANSLPVFIQSLSEYRAPLFIYSTVPFVGVFGLNEWGVRLPAVFWGVLGVLGVFFLTRKILDERLGLIAAFILTVSPWHIHYSRAAFEVTMLLAVSLFATLFFLKGIKQNKYLFLSAVLFALTPYIYRTAVVFTPLLITLLIVLFKEEVIKNIKIYLGSLLLIFLILFPFTMQIIYGQVSDRFSAISIFTDQVLKDKITLAQKAGVELDIPHERLFHNKPLVWAQVFTLNYLRAFSPEFLFTSGDPNFRHSIHEMGQLYYAEIILLILGIWVLTNTQGGINKERKLILGWLLFAPIPAALTADGGFHATRTFIILPALVIISSIGCYAIWERIHEVHFRYLAVLLSIMLMFNFVFFMHRYFIHYPNESWLAWHYGFKEVLTFVKENNLNFDKILINNTYEPSLIRFLFWTRYDPDRFHQFFSKDQIIKNVTDGFNGFSLEDKYFFGRVNRPFENLVDSRTLYVASARDDVTNLDSLKHTNIKLLKTVYSPTGQPIFYLITGVKQ